jgi:predicted N-formylglutamate amidohydrolase
MSPFNDGPKPRILRPEDKSQFVILCDHASRHIPAELEDLGLPPAELVRHIAWDIGAAGVAEALSEILDAPAVLSPVSRLVIDCNRHLDAADLIPKRSDGTVIPGNRGLSGQARVRRIERWFIPYHAAIESILDERATRGVMSIALSIHSMTDNLAGSRRPWQIAFSSHEDRSLVQPMIDILRRSSDIEVGDNQPYSMDPAIDYSIPFHALRRNLPYLQVEFRQDEVQDAEAQVRWAKRFASALAETLAFHEA